MIPELFRVGPLAISPFGVAMMVAFIVAYFELRRGMAATGAGDAEDAGALVFWGAFAGIVGAKVYYTLLYQDWRLLFQRWGLVWYGGFIAATVTLLIVIRRRRLPLAATADALAVALALGYGIGRIGCFLVGDDYGRPTDLPWGVAFPRGLPPTTAGDLREQFGFDVPPEIADAALLRVHPTQLYETAASLAIWWVGRHLLRAGGPAGRPALAVLALLAAERFAVETLRVKDDRFFGPLSLAQVISLAILVVVAALWLRLRRRRAAAAAPA
jgi:phosphatidylglycerol:prolipoprotein diacylglycerol transferase